MQSRLSTIDRARERSTVKKTTERIATFSVRYTDQIERKVDRRWGQDGSKRGLGTANILRTFAMQLDASRCNAVALHPSRISCHQVVHEG